MIKHDQTTWKTSTKCHHSSLLIPPREVPRRLRADCNLSSRCRLSLSAARCQNRTSLKGLQAVQTRLGVNPLNHLCCFWKPYIALYINVLNPWSSSLFASTVFTCNHHSDLRCWQQIGMLSRTKEPKQDNTPTTVFHCLSESIIYPHYSIWPRIADKISVIL